MILGGAAGGTAHIDGGRGTDAFGALSFAPEALGYDLDAGTAMLGGVDHATFEVFEDLGAVGVDHPVSVRGTNGPNRITVLSTNGRVAGLGGDDRIDVGGCGTVAQGGAGADALSVAYPAACSSDTVRLYGGAGADVLTGSRHRDVLIGGAGRDTARGGKGKDACQAEVERSCERS